MNEHFEIESFERTTLYDCWSENGLKRRKKIVTFFGANSRNEALEYQAYLEKKKVKKI